MSVAMETGIFYSFLEGHDQRGWEQALEHLFPSIHPVDQMATRIWFSFWPLKLARELKNQDEQQVIGNLELDGNFRLEDQLDDAVSFLYGSRYWSTVKKVTLDYLESCTEPASRNLEEHIRKIAARIAEELDAELSLLLGISAVGLMSAQQIGEAAFTRWASRPPVTTGGTPSPESILKKRSRSRQKGGLFSFLHTVDRRHTVTFQEGRRDATYPLIHGQDLSSGAANDPRDYRSLDHRRPAGPVPFQCRSGACGFCWVGVLAGHENLDPMSDFEKRRLQLFGYLPEKFDEKNPPVRLSCQTKCRGDVTIVIPTWNGVLKTRY